MRTIIDLPEDQLEALDALCAKEGISRAEAIRRAVGGMLRDRRPVERERAFGLWRGRPEGVDYQRKMRREWRALLTCDGRDQRRRNVPRPTPKIVYKSVNRPDGAAV